MQRPDAQSDVIDSWKEISRYLNRDIRTIQRWEHERGLPVRRLPGGLKPGVYALKAELDAWRRNRGLHIASAEGATLEPLASVAVLPFLNLTADPEDQYRADGLADEVIATLSRLPELRVTARTSSFVFRAKEQDIRAIGRRLNVRTVLEGTYQRSGNRIRVTAQLVETSEGYHLWSDHFDAKTGDVFALQDEIASAICRQVRVRLSSDAPSPAPPIPKPAAYHLWLKARYHSLRHTPEEILRSRALCEQAIAADPRFARAYLGLAESLWECAFFGLDHPRDAIVAGRQAVFQALEIDPALGEAHSMLGVYLGIGDFEWEAAEDAFKRALDLVPGSSESRTRYAAWLLEPNLRLDEARDQLNLALESDPLSPIVLAFLGHHMIFRRDFQRAAELLELAVELEPAYFWAQIYLAGSYGFQGRLDLAGKILTKLLESTRGCPLVIGSFAIGYGLAGDRPRAEEFHKQLLDSTWPYVSPLAFAWFHMGLGETEACLDWLERAVQERNPPIVEFQPKPLYDGLRGHPRFQALLASMRLRTAREAQA